MDGAGVAFFPGFGTACGFLPGGAFRAFVRFAGATTMAFLFHFVQLSGLFGSERGSNFLFGRLLESIRFFVGFFMERAFRGYFLFKDGLNLGLLVGAQTQLFG
jgi:hypothetical protein